jgi:broad specificity phosphatase PhoE
MVRLLLARHCQSTWNGKGLIQGQKDPPLSAEGEAQARALGERLQSETLGGLYCSDLARGYQTAQAIGACHDLIAVRDADLRERGYGAWEGQPLADLMANTVEWEKHRRDPDWAPVGAENGPALYQRTQAALRRIVHRHEGQTVAVVMHGGGLRMYFCHVFGLSLEHYWQVTVSHAGLSIVDWQDNEATLIAWNDSHHVSGLAATSTIY